MLKRASLFISFLFAFNLLAFSKPTENSCTVIEHQTKCKANKDKLSVETSVLIEIRNRSAEKYAEIKIPYSKKKKLTILIARIEDMNGNIIRELKKSDFKDRNAYLDNFYEDQFIKEFEMKHNEYPYRIRYAWRSDYDEFIDLVDWRPYIDRKVITEKASLEVRVPQNYPVRTYQQNIQPAVRSLQEQDSVFTFEATGLELPASETNEIPSEKIGVNVKVLPLEFFWNQPGSHASWKEFGNWIYNLNKGSDDLTELDRAGIRELVKGIIGKREIIDRLYKYLQEHTRYIDVYIGAGGLKPYPASYVLQNKYGDCKALAVYMQAMLNAVNIRSYYTLVYADYNDPGIIREIPDQQFNHAILCVPLGKDTMFLDCTRKNVPPGYMGTFTQGREALLIAKDSSHFVQIPALKPLEVEERSHHDYALEIGNLCTVSIYNKSKGENFDYFNYVKETLDHTESERLLRERHFDFASFDLKEWNLNQPYKDSVFMLLKANLQINNFLKNYGNEQGFPIYPLDVKSYERPAERKLPLHIDYPVNILDDFTYHFPASLNVSFLPENQTIESRFGKYSLAITSKENQIQVQRRFELYPGDYPLGDYPEFYAFIQKVTKTNRSVILLTK